eukprot:6682004-Pyramimonas_sp.AAC.1
MVRAKLLSPPPPPLENEIVSAIDHDIDSEINTIIDVRSMVRSIVRSIVRSTTRPHNGIDSDRSRGRSIEESGPPSPINLLITRREVA